MSTRIGIHVCTWVPLIKEPSDKGMPLTTADFTAVCNTFHHQQERSSSEGQEATRRMVIPSIAMFIIPRGTLDPPLCPYLHAPYFKTLTHSEKRQAQENSRRVALNDPATRLQPRTKFMAILETPVTITYIIFTNILIFYARRQILLTF